VQIAIDLFRGAGLENGPGAMRQRERDLRELLGKDIELPAGNAAWSPMGFWVPCPLGKH
jgi:hypothetical protein